ncbi:MAG: TetR/AcrR family transcriptional regulator [Pseudomonadota bacterium]
MKAEKQTARRAAIEAKALELLDEKGFDGTSMAAIAKAASASIETLYRWYGDKQGLYAALVARNAARIAQSIGAPSTKHHGLAALRRIAPILLEVLTDGPAVALNRAAAGDRTGALGAALASAGRDAVVPRLREVVETAMTRGELTGDAGEITETFVALVVGDLQVRRATRAMPALTKDAITRRADRAVEHICRLYGADADA